MIKFNKIEQQYSFFSQGMLLSVLIGIVLLFQGIWDDLLLNLRSQEQLLTMKYISSVHSSGIFDILAPMLAALPSSVSFCDEFKSGYFNFIKVRTERNSYIFNKILSVGVSGGMAVGMPVLFVNVLLLIIGDKYCMSIKGSYDSDIFANSIFEKIEYAANGWVVAFIIVFFAFLFGMAWSLAGLAVSTIIVNRYIAMFLPFTIYFLMFMIFARLELYMFSPVNLICPDMTFIPSFLFVILYLVSLIVFFLIIAVTGISRRWKN